MFTAQGCPSGFTFLAEGNSCYMVVQQSLNQSNAAAYCASLNSHLVYIRNQSEQDAIVYLLKNTMPGFGTSILFNRIQYGGLKLPCTLKNR